MIEDRLGEIPSPVEKPGSPARFKRVCSRNRRYLLALPERSWANLVDLDLASLRPFQYARLPEVPPAPPENIENAQVARPLRGRSRTHSFRGPKTHLPPSKSRPSFAPQ